MSTTARQCLDNIRRSFSPPSVSFHLMQMSPTLSPSSIPSHPLPRLAPIPFAAAAISLIIIHCVVNAPEKEESLSLSHRSEE